MEVDRLQKALRTSDSKLTIMANQLNENEAKMQQMQSERKKQLADVMQMKHDALAAALGEKNAHIALLEVSSYQILSRLYKKRLRACMYTSLFMDKICKITCWECPVSIHALL